MNDERLMLLPKLDNNTWSTLLIESVLIVLSVIIGFLVTEWRQAAENQELAQSAKQNVLAEIDRNYQRVAGARAYHLALRDTLQQLNDPSLEAVSRVITTGFLLSDSTRRAGFVSPADVLETAWATAQTTGAVRYLRLDDVQMLSSVYASQSNYRAHRDWFGQTFMVTTMEKGASGLLTDYQNIDLILAQFASQEQQLLSAYDQALQHFDRSMDTSVDSIEVMPLSASDVEAASP